MHKQVKAMAEKTKSERRRRKRYELSGNAYAVVDSHFTQLAHVIDVSEEGISFLYTGQEIEKGRNINMEIFLYNDSKYAEKVSAKVVNNLTVSNKSLLDFVVLMRCCLKFDRLDEKQQKNIVYLISNYSSNPQ